MQPQTQSVPFVVINKVLFNYVQLTESLRIPPNHKHVLVDRYGRTAIPICGHVLQLKPSVHKYRIFFASAQISCLISPTENIEGRIVLIVDCREKCSRLAHTRFFEKSLIAFEKKDLICVLLAIFCLTSQKVNT